MQPRRTGAVAVGLALAWGGLALTWERWSGLSDSDATRGFSYTESRPYLIALAVVTPLAIAVAVRGGKRLGVALCLAGAALVGLAAHAAVGLYAVGSAFVSVIPGLGLWMSVLGSLVLALAVPPRRPVVGALAAVIVTAGALSAWPREQRPADGHVSEVAQFHADTLSVAGDAVYSAGVSPDIDVYTGDQRLRTAASVDEDDIIQHIVVRGRELYATTGTYDRFVRIDADGVVHRIAARQPFEHERERRPAGMHQVHDFEPKRLAIAPDGGVYVLSHNRVYRWRDGKFDAFAGTGTAGFGGDGGPARDAKLDAPRDIAVDGAGNLYIADTGNGRVRRVDRDGTIRTVLGTRAAPRCVTRGGDDPLALDPSRCLGVERLAADARGNLFLTTRGVAYVLGLTPSGRFGVVAGTGLRGFYEGDGRGPSVRVGHITSLAIGPHGDLFLAESDPLPRVRRIAAPASLIGAKPGRPAPAPQPACQAITGWAQATWRLAGIDDREPAQLKRAIFELMTALERLEAVAPDGIEDDAQRAAEAIEALDARLDAVRYDATRLAPVAISEPLEVERGDGETIGDFGEKRCGLLGAAFDVEPHEAMRFCLVYQRFEDVFGKFERDDPRRERAYREVTPLMPDSVVAPGREDTPGAAKLIDLFADRVCVVAYHNDPS